MTQDNHNLSTSDKDKVLEQTLVFKAGQELFGISLASVLEVFQPSSSIRPVPGAPRWLAGMLHHQGEVLPVVRADALLGAEAEQQANIQLILMDLNIQKILLQVDEIVALESIQSGGPARSDGQRRAWLKGRLLTVLDIDNVNRLIKSRLKTTIN